jgi:hypothetical protein
MALTDTEIKKAKAKEKAYSLNDSGGLYLWITPAGGKLWRWAYRFGGKEKLMSLGKYPDVPLALARERHAEARKLLATGVDPMAQRKAEKTAEKIAVENSFQSVTKQWLEHWQEGKSSRHSGQSHLELVEPRLVLPVTVGKSEVSCRRISCPAKKPWSSLVPVGKGLRTRAAAMLLYMTFTSC